MGKMQKPPELKLVIHNDKHFFRGHENGAL